ncbi:primosomal protein N' [Alteromonas facilis]|uniref:primosomal protein N' n=1 Tax=Alteromonas facilis TaxID=2048004 RepID=UPI000C28B373|nr:primosomal protein N' [Alteromonas facilis]
MSFIRVALPVPMRRLFDYRSEAIPAGCRVVVEFGKREMVGIVLEHTELTGVDGDKIKPISARLDELPVMDEELLSLGQWLADYHHHPIGDVLFTMLPALLRKATPLTAPSIDYFQLTSSGEAQLQQTMRAKQQQALLSFLSAGLEPQSDVRAQFGQSVIKACVEKEWIVAVSKEVSPQLDWHVPMTLAKAPAPNADQALAIANINTRQGEYAPFLLEGVTGSGKTEVYLQVITPLLEAGRQVLILVPEIGLTPQTVRRFETRFGIDVGVLHSGMTDNERLTVWQRAREGSLGLVIGTRSAIYTPFKQLGMIIVDEEHDESYKQQDGMRYHARDVAVLRAKRLALGLILGSATPSFESLNNALSGKYHLLQLHQRTGQSQMVAQRVHDIRGEQLEAGISGPMLSKMREHLSAGGQVMVFINRRGFAPSLVCHQCGHVAQCNRCDAPFTVHKAVSRLQCHRCDNTQRLLHQCEVCGSNEIGSQGVGTEQLKEYLDAAFPSYSTIRIDSDSMRGKQRLANAIDDINANKHQIMIGTQILSKGHHFPLVTLVLVIDVDGALFSADLRATEKLAQLLTQVAGRAGRENRHGEMWLQTHHPDHPLLLDLLHNGYHHFSRYALSERRAAQAPPFYQQTVFRAEANQLEPVNEFLDAVKRTLERHPKLTVIGPLPALMFKRAGRFRMLLIVKSEQRQYVHAAIASQLDYIEGLKSATRVRWAIDVAPTDLS